MRLFLAAITAPVTTAALLNCYYPDGTTTAPGHTPCNTTISASACCAPEDSCSTSGLCLGRTGFSYRGSCTDKTWASGNCPSECQKGKDTRKSLTEGNYSLDISQTPEQTWPTAFLPRFGLVTRRDKCKRTTAAPMQITRTAVQLQHLLTDQPVMPSNLEWIRCW